MGVQNECDYGLEHSEMIISNKEFDQYLEYLDIVDRFRDEQEFRIDILPRQLDVEEEELKREYFGSVL